VVDVVPDVDEDLLELLVVVVDELDEEVVLDVDELGVVVLVLGTGSPGGDAVKRTATSLATGSAPQGDDQ
jgi:hypothetical protein